MKAMIIAVLRVRKVKLVGVAMVEQEASRGCANVKVGVGIPTVCKFY
jgi:hypothetical protein